MSWAHPTGLDVTRLLVEKHYLGTTHRGAAWVDEFGCLVIAAPTSRRLPVNWLELSRWCISSTERNAGSRQWGAFVKSLRKARPDVTTIISYSDPSQGHTGALYRACNWWWAPTWHRFSPPPSGNGSWHNGKYQNVKDRWVFALRRDAERLAILRASWPAYREPGGVPLIGLAERHHG